MEPSFERPFPSRSNGTPSCLGIARIEHGSFAASQSFPWWTRSDFFSFQSEISICLVLLFHDGMVPFEAVQGYFGFFELVFDRCTNVNHF